MDSQNTVLGNAAAAAIVGSLAGAAAGFLSVPIWPPTFTTSAQIPIVEAGVASPMPPAVPPAPVTVSKPPSSAPAVRAPSPAAPDAANPLRRAEELARRPDVRGLLALREELAQRAASRGEQASAETRRQLEEVDRYLNDARARQLQRDAQELRRSAGGPVESR